MADTEILHAIQADLAALGAKIDSWPDLHMQSGSKPTSPDFATTCAS